MAELELSIGTIFSTGPLRINSPNVQYSAEEITAKVAYESTSVSIVNNEVHAVPTAAQFVITTQRRVPTVGVMVVGLGGNNGSTLAGALLANKLGLSWRTKSGTNSADYLGSLTQSSTVRIGSSMGRDVYCPFNSVLPMLSPNDIVIGGWDISKMTLADAMQRAAVFEPDLQRQLHPLLTSITPLPSIYYPDFIAANQSTRADNLLDGDDKGAHLRAIRDQIRSFKAAHGLEKVIVLWSANTERYSDIIAGVNDSEDALMRSIARSEPEVSPSTIFAVAAALEGCTYINGSPQNTFVPGVMDLAQRLGVFIAGDDFKSGQTKMKSVLVDFLCGAGIKPTSIVSYNHLGNNDGKNLSAPSQFRSKEISKSNVVDDVVESNGLLYAPGEHPDHCVVIKYVPSVGDSKRALDEYESRIFMGGTSTISLYNRCEDSLLAAPLMVDLIVLAELFERITLRRADEPVESASRFHSVLSLLSYCLKAPLVPRHTPVVNALFKQREALVNIIRACVGLPPENHMLLEHRISSAGTIASLQRTGLLPVDAAQQKQPYGAVANGVNGVVKDKAYHVNSAQPKRRMSNTGIATSETAATDLTTSADC